jgi:glycerol kinase
MLEPRASIADQQQTLFGVGCVKAGASDKHEIKRRRDTTGTGSAAVAVGDG